MAAIVRVSTRPRISRYALPRFYSVNSDNAAGKNKFVLLDRQNTYAIRRSAGSTPK